MLLAKVSIAVASRKTDDFKIRQPHHSVGGGDEFPRSAFARGANRAGDAEVKISRTRRKRRHV
jgi:hypothetical protein